ncbi:MAG: TIGR01906 family membrane protein [Anaerolineae bacterium]
MKVKPFLRVLIVLAVPIVLTMTMVRLLTLPWYPAWEYRRPGFPADPLGMSESERLRLAAATVRFLNVPWQTDSLKDLQLPDDTPAYNARELGHMDDVKRVYNALTLTALVLAVGAILSGWGLRQAGNGCEALASLQQGGVFTLLVLISLAVWMAVAFNQFFTFFHSLFFQPGTWVFSYRDTLIRLFPLKFWEDAGLLIAGGVSLSSLLLTLLAGWLKRRCEPA